MTLLTKSHDPPSNSLGPEARATQALRGFLSGVLEYEQIPLVDHGDLEKFRKVAPRVTP